MEVARTPVARRTAWCALWALGALLALCAAQSLLHVDDLGPLEPVLGRWGVDIVLVGGALLVLVRAWLVRAERLVWGVVGLGTLLWAAGNVYYTAVLWDRSPIPIPSLSDGLWIAFYPLGYAGLVLLVRRRVGAPGATLWLDGAIAALAVGALGAASVFGRVLASTGGAPAEVATNLAYPIGDTVLVGVATAAVALGGWRLTRTWALMAGGFAVFGVSDCVYLVANAVGSWVPGSIGECGWPLGFLLIAAAAWSPDHDRPRRVTAGARRQIVAPIAFALLALVLLVADRFVRLNLLAVILAWLCVLAVLARLAASYAGNLRTLRGARTEAITDALTGLGNRRGLLRDLDARLERGGEGVLALFDLNGFKGYNDAFGHPAGDALLRRLSGRLAGAVGPGGAAYRMGGDEFCVLAPGGASAALALLERCCAALAEHGDGFAVTAASGAVLLGEEASDAAGALGLADRRMYADKGGRRSPEEQTTGVLLTALGEHHPDLGGHLEDVGSAAVEVGRRLGLTGRALDDLRRAGQLHDVGKIAVPAAILDKPSRLDPDEWAFIARHTLIGERILLAAPALAAIAPVVRSSHERWDGGGYPDGLAGEAIPLGARIITACDAFDAMRSDRPYRAALPLEEAVEELLRCSGSHFDPVVVDALRAVVADEVAAGGGGR